MSAPPPLIAHAASIVVVLAASAFLHQPRTTVDEVERISPTGVAFVKPTRVRTFGPR